MAADDTLARVVEGMGNRSIDPYSAAEVVLENMLENKARTTEL
jgi:hypothetical protein